MRLLSVALHETAEAPALLHGRRLQREPCKAGWSWADAMRAMERNAGKKKPDLKTKLPTQKTNPTVLSNEVSKLTTTVGSKPLCCLSGRRRMVSSDHAHIEDCPQDTELDLFRASGLGVSDDADGFGRHDDPVGILAALWYSIWIVHPELVASTYWPTNPID